MAFEFDTPIAQKIRLNTKITVFGVEVMFEKSEVFQATLRLMKNCGADLESSIPIAAAVCKNLIGDYVFHEFSFGKGIVLEPGSYWLHLAPDNLLLTGESSRNLLTREGNLWVFNPAHTHWIDRETNTVFKLNVSFFGKEIMRALETARPSS